MATVLSIIGGLATISGAAYGMFKLVVWMGSKSSEQKKEESDAAVDAEETQVQQTGRPKK